MKVAILYICTGKYNQFFADFYASAEKYFLSEVAQRHYFVWTDDKALTKAKNVTLIHKESAGFPADSLFRFEMFMQVEDELKKYDYIYFFNSNAVFLQHVGQEILPDDSGLSMGIWPGQREKQHPMFYPYERNRRSLAYVAPYGKNYTYFMGGVNGGRADCYLQMIRTLHQNIRDDYHRGIIAKVHDESHINAYLRTRPCKKLGREFCLPEEWRRTEDCPKIMLRDKVKIDPYFNKGRNHSLWGKAQKGGRIVINVLRWYLKF